MSEGYSHISLFDPLKTSAGSEIRYVTKKRDSLSVSPVDVSLSIIERQIKRDPYLALQGSKDDYHRMHTLGGSWFRSEGTAS